MNPGQVKQTMVLRQRAGTGLAVRTWRALRNPKLAGVVKGGVSAQPFLDLRQRLVSAAGRERPRLGRDNL